MSVPYRLHTIEAKLRELDPERLARIEARVAELERQVNALETYKPAPYYPEAHPYLPTPSFPGAGWPYPTGPATPSYPGPTSWPVTICASPGEYRLSPETGGSSAQPLGGASQEANT